MATQLRYLASSVSGTAANPDNALGNTATTFAGVTNANTSWSHVWAMALPTEPELAPVSQTFTVNARKGSNTGNPTMTINVQRPLGTTLATISATITSSTNSQGVSLTWTPPAGTPSSDPFYIEVVVTAAGGSPSARNSIEVSHAIWIAQTLMPAPKTGAGVGGVYAYTGSASGVTPAILPRAGDTAGAYGFTGSANGRLSARGIATGDYTWEGSASGTRAARGSAEGVWGFQGNADATAKMRGSASGSWGYSGGTAAGKRSPKGSVSGEFGYEGETTGYRKSSGSASGAYKYEGSIAGVTLVGGAATGEYGWLGNAEGKYVPAGSASGVFVWTGFVRISRDITIFLGKPVFVWAAKADLRDWVALVRTFQWTAHHAPFTWNTSAISYREWESTKVQPRAWNADIRALTWAASSPTFD